MRLGIEKEWRDIHRTLRNSGIALDAQRVPPTERKLQDALRRGPAILHLTCHGSIIHTADGAMAVLHLEDENGKDAPLRGNLLATMPPRGVLRLVLLSACHTAEGRDSDIARLLVTSGVPFAIGMQGKFLDALSEPFAVALYDTLLAGQSLAEALRQARQAIANHPAQVGLPVGYTAREAWGALPLTQGQPIVGSLGLPGKVQLASEVQPPRPLLGRNRELHALAQIYARGHRVVTITGTGGIGKTALAAAFAERFAWRWAEGVRSVSFASDVVDAQMFRLALLRELEGESRAQQFADADAETQTREILRFLRDWDGLLLIDNYESVLQRFETTADGRPPTGDSQAAAVHRLVAQMAEGGASLLLTSRQNPAGLRGEVVFPRPNESLAGLARQAGAELFYQHSTKAKGQWDSETVRQLAQEIARVTEGHPLAIALLAGEFDTSDVSPADFLKNWENELADARRPGMAPHHITFAAAFERSYNRLTPEQQKRLRALSVFAFPFYAQGAIVWTDDDRPLTTDGTVDEDRWLAQVRERLGEFTRRNLLEIDGWFKDGTPAAYRFQPALRQEIARRLSAEERAALMPAYAAYAFWFVDVAREAITREPAVARRAQQAANELIALADAQPADRLAHYCWQLGIILQQFGRISDAEKILERGEASAKTQSDDVRLARILVVKANLAVIRGKLDDAMSLYDQAARLLKNREDKQGVSAVFHQMARIYVTRGRPGRVRCGCISSRSPLMSSWATYGAKPRRCQ
jgi:tetratricopeptide (TPR) repeat protein